MLQKCFIQDSSKKLLKSFTRKNSTNGTDTSTKNDAGPSSKKLKRPLPPDDDDEESDAAVIVILELSMLPIKATKEEINQYFKRCKPKPSEPTSITVLGDGVAEVTFTEEMTTRAKRWLSKTLLDGKKSKLIKKMRGRILLCTDNQSQIFLKINILSKKYDRAIFS